MKKLTPLRLRHAADKAAADLPSMMAEAERAAAHVLAGGHNLRRPGGGENFWQFRDYELHDSPQDIDWRQSAKGDRVSIRQKERQTSQSVYFWCAGGPSMTYGSRMGKHTKADEAAILILALSLLLTRSGELVSMTGGFRRPGRSEHTLSRLGEQLLEQIYSNHPLPDADTRDLPTGHTAILAGDFLSEPGKVADSLAEVRMAASSGFLVQVLDPAELDLPFAGRAIFRDPAGGARHETDNAADIRDAYRARIRAHAESIRHVCREAGWGYYLHRTDHPLADTLAELWALLSPEARKAGGFP
ncbi:MAG: DUF58 domain-containing protein [Alphaproteobacteria bacterium]|nr:DUF58 domain-containing protein [Alphaproteobacteria bacterium]